MKLFCRWPILIDARTGEICRAPVMINGQFGIPEWMYKACIETEAEAAADAVRARYA